MRDLEHIPVSYNRIDVDCESLVLVGLNKAVRNRDRWIFVFKAICPVSDARRWSDNPTIIDVFRKGEIRERRDYIGYGQARTGSYVDSRCPPGINRISGYGDTISCDWFSGKLEGGSYYPGTLFQAERVSTGVKRRDALFLAGRHSSLAIGIAGVGSVEALNQLSLSYQNGILSGFSSVLGSIGAFPIDRNLAQEKPIGDSAGHEQQPSKDHGPAVENKLASLIFLFFGLLFLLASFYFFQSSIDDKAFINVWKVFAGFAMLGIGHVFGYYCLVGFGL